MEVDVPPRAGGIQYIFIGHMVGLVLLGFSLMQTWMVLNTHQRDSWRMKLLVSILIVADVAQSVCGCHAVNAWLVSHYAQPTYLNHMLPGFLGATEAGAIVAFICQMFFAWRVHRLRRQWWLTSTVVFFGTSGVLCATGTVIGCAFVHTFDQLDKLKPVILVWSTTVVVCDIFTTTALVLTLHRAITGFRDTDSRIAEIKNLILQTFALTMVIDLLHLLIVAIKPSDLLHLCFNSFVCKLYSNSLLSTLNSRSSSTSQLLGQETSIRVSSSPTWDNDTKNSNQTMNQDIPLPPLPPATSHVSRHHSKHRPGRSRPGDIHITTVQEQFTYSEPEVSHSSRSPPDAVGAGTLDPFDDRKKSVDVASGDLDRVQLAAPSAPSASAPASAPASQEASPRDPPRDI